MKNLSQKILGIIIIAAAALCSATAVFAQAGYGGGGGAGGGGGGVGGCKASYDNWGGCYTRSSGVFWVLIPAYSDSMPFNDLHTYNENELVHKGGSKYFIYLRKDVRGAAIQNCLTGGGAAYVLVVRHYFSDGNYHGLGAGIPLSEAWDYHVDGQEYAAPFGVEGVAWETAHAQFEKDKEFYAGPPWYQHWGPDSSLTWFCYDMTGSSRRSSSTTTTSSETIWGPDCYGTRTREWGETVSRIAVRNATLDKTTKYAHKGNWRAPSGLRTGANNESDWTAGGGNYWTVAKPGDSIQFVHEYCVNARFARQVPTPDSWGSSQSHSKLFTIPADRLVISAEVSGVANNNFAFGDGISWMNSQTASVTNRGNPEADPFTQDSGISGAKRYKWGDGYYGGIGTLSPTSAVTRYKCSDSQYNKYDKWAGAGTFQIPGWISGRSCSSATLAGKTNLVGEVITQKHTFRMVKAWEQWTSNSGGSCGCDPGGDTAWYGGHLFSSDYARGMSHWGYQKDNDCEKKADNDSSCSCWKDIVRDEYNNIISCTHYTSHKFTSPSYEWYYHSTAKNYGDATKTASVYIPFNFETTVHASIDTTDVVYQGGPVESDFSWKIDPRVNKVLTESKVSTAKLSKYATYTPDDTKIQMIEFIMEPDEDPSGTSQPIAGSKTSRKDPCAYYADSIYKRPDGTKECQVLDEIVGPQNPTGDYKGSFASTSRKRTVPDGGEYVGFKYCVAVGIYPSDSHDYQTNTLDAQRLGGFGGAMDAGEYWNVSHASCRTISKKPSVQVWNGSTYTEGDIMTSIYKKIVGYEFGDESKTDTYGNNYKDADTQVFGSWTDYSIISNGKVRGMSSGAVLGYDNSQYDLRGSGGQPTSSTDYTRLNALTIANTGSEKGKSGINASSAIDINLQRLYSRYRDKAATLATKEAPQSQLSIRTAESGMQYAYVSGSAKLSQLSIKSYGDSKHPNQTLVRSGNDVFKKLGNGKDDNTLVIYTTGDFTIDQNICLGDKCDGAGMKLSEYKSGTSTNAADKLPQVLIFAKNISVAQNVSRVDAWLITADDGELNTCAGFKAGTNIQARDAYERYPKYGNCYKTLIVNGPVYTKTLSLNRTAGAFHGKGQTWGISDPRDRQYGAAGNANDGNLGSEIPAEIFNLRSDVYLWAYNQAQRYSEAVVTYMRELAPRY